jgi:hypothetical protein
MAAPHCSPRHDRASINTVIWAVAAGYGRYAALRRLPALIVAPFCFQLLLFYIVKIRLLFARSTHVL